MARTSACLSRAAASLRLSAALLLAFVAVRAEAVPIETMGADWFPGGVQSVWAQVVPNFGGEPDHGLLTLSDLERALSAPDGDSGLRSRIERVVDRVNFADDLYNEAWGTTEWGTQGDLPPLFQVGDGNEQNDWGALFQGEIGVAEAGWYNFGVLSDDGFSFELSANSQLHRVFQDGLNPRNRYGLPEDLYLQPGRYAFTLEAYDHLEAGVVSLGVWQDLERPAPVPEPSTAMLFLTGLFGCAVIRRRRQYRT